MMGGLGQNPASSLGNGLSSANPATGLANSGGGPAAAANPGAAFARGLSSSGSAVPPVASTVAPPPAAGSPAPPLQALSASGGGTSGAAAPAGAGGVHVPATPPPAPPPSQSSSAGGGGGAPAPMMLPSTGMGNPAASGGPVAPMGSTSSSTSSGAASPVPPAVSGNVGPTLVPAAVLAGADPQRAVRGLSADGKAAALLAWRLWHDCRRVGFPVDWAVGVFRSSEGSETVVHSSEGSGYVPANVHVPRGVRLLMADELVDSAFRRKWFGRPDPVETLVEYAGVRREAGWGLVAAAATEIPVAGTGVAESLRGRGVEFVRCRFDDSPLKRDDPVAPLDEMHVHRLQLEYPDLYDRLMRVSATADRAVVESLLGGLTQELVDGALGVEVERFEDTAVRDALRDRWEQVRSAAPRAVAPTAEELADEWRPFSNVVTTTFLLGTALRPHPGFACPGEGAEPYCKAWPLARALEAVSAWAGWPQHPISLPDVVYAVAAVDPTADFREKIGQRLHAAEAAMGG
jgi:hypothetical protein